MKTNAPRNSPAESVNRSTATRLVLDPPDSALEAEADRVADQTVAAPGHNDQSAPSARVQRSTNEQADGTATAAPDSVERALAGAGEPLEPVLRNDMEHRFGHDFSQVRVHSDSAADESTRDINANAFTVGHHIAFAAGRYAPGSHDGDRLIAHELTHVVQQSGARASVQRDDKKKSAPAPKVVAPVAPSSTQKKMIEAARKAAALRIQAAAFKARGLQGHEALEEARRLARIKFNWADPNMEQIGDILGGMGGGLITVDVKVAGPGDPECGSRSGYVRDHRAPIVLCPGFFKNPADNERRIRTMIYEMAHVKGIGKADVAEQYLMVFDCTSVGAFESADAWSNYVHCLSGQTPEENVASRKPGKAPAAGGKSAPKKEGGGK